MGLAASQARFLCITARKADCEYRSTALAQEKLDITKQLSDISTQYAQSMNATKLIWQNGAIENDFGVTYSLLMMPTAANDYNPYMITSPSGAIVLNTEYAAAARAAGISKAGGVGSQESRDKFISALAYQGLVTQPTADAITKYDYRVDASNPTDVNGKIVFNNPTVGESNGVIWNPAAGMGAQPLNKTAVEPMTFPDLCLSENIGQRVVDWAKLFAGGNITQLEKDAEIDRLSELLASVENKGSEGVTSDVINQLRRSYNDYKNTYKKDSATDYYKKQCKDYEDLILMAERINFTDAAGNLVDEEGKAIIFSDGKTMLQHDAVGKIKERLQKDLNTCKNLTAVSVESEEFKKLFNLTKPNLTEATLSVVQDGVINHYAAELKEMTISDILSGDVVLMAVGTGNGQSTVTEVDAEKFSEYALNLLDSFAAIFGYSSTDDLSGQGLNQDDASAQALKFAYDMVKNTYLRPKGISNIGSRYNSKYMQENSAFLNATSSNRIGGDDTGKYYGISLSNMLSAFLTYYDNCLSGVNSPYVVGKTTDTSIYVTDDYAYYYIAESDEGNELGIVTKSADFYDQLYNNIIEHGWREDSAIDDAEYLEAALKDGRYSMSSLNQDGYFYQTRYNETGYMIEVSDTDAIERAEAEFTSMKAQLTYKEDSIDLKTKKLDAEISALSTEYDTVKNLISKSIEKTFALFQN